MLNHPYISLSDAELTELLRCNDKVAFTVIYHKYFDKLYMHAYQKLGDKQESQDVVHELFAQLWHKRGDITIYSNLMGYLYTGVRNRILDIITHKQVESKYINSLQNFIESNHYITTDYRIREKQLEELINKAIASLPEKMREIFELSRNHSLTHKEIAKQLNISELTVKKQINNALKVLRVRLSMFLFLQL